MLPQWSICPVHMNIKQHSYRVLSVQCFFPLCAFGERSGCLKEQVHVTKKYISHKLSAVSFTCNLPDIAGSGQASLIGNGLVLSRQFLVLTNAHLSSSSITSSGSTCKYNVPLVSSSPKNQSLCQPAPLPQPQVLDLWLPPDQQPFSITIRQGPIRRCSGCNILSRDKTKEWPDLEKEMLQRAQEWQSLVSFQWYGKHIYFHLNIECVRRIGSH